MQIDSAEHMSPRKTLLGEGAVCEMILSGLVMIVTTIILSTIISIIISILAITSLVIITIVSSGSRPGVWDLGLWVCQSR